MLLAVLPPWLIAYGDTIAAYDSFYGWKCCGLLLYQQSCRFLQEHFTRMLRRESIRYEKAIEINVTNLDEEQYEPAKPFTISSTWPPLRRWLVEQSTDGGK